MNLSQILIKPVLTEKSVEGESSNKFTFIVHEEATKVDVKHALHQLYGVQAEKVNMLKGLAKFRMGRHRNLLQKRSSTRRAIVTLKEGEKLDLAKTKTNKSTKSATAQ